MTTNQDHHLCAAIARAETWQDFMSLQLIEIPAVQDDGVRLALRYALQDRREKQREAMLASGNVWLPKRA